MSLKKKEGLAKYLADIGNYQSAINLFQELHKMSSEFEDRSFFEGEIKRCKECLKKTSELNIGEAFFPVYDENSTVCSVLTIRITPEPTSGKVFDINDIKINVVKYLDSIIKKSRNEIDRVQILDWNSQLLKAEIKNTSSESRAFRKFVKTVDGKSVELAIVVALISYFLKLEVPNNIAFSSLVDFGAENPKLYPADELPGKISAIKLERPFIKKLVTYGKPISTKGFLVEIPTLKDAIDVVFKNMEVKMETQLLKQESLRKISLKIRDIKDIREGFQKEKLLLFAFKHPSLEAGIVNNDEIPAVFEFLTNVSRLLKGRSAGVVLDGLIPSYMNPMLALIQGFSNGIGNFLAVRYGKAHDGIADAAVVRTTKDDSPYKLGDVLRYKIPV